MSKRALPDAVRVSIGRSFAFGVTRAPGVANAARPAIDPGYDKGRLRPEKSNTTLSSIQPLLRAPFAFSAAITSQPVTFSCRLT
ncbi:MAG TPA: hypothetical protein VJX94_31890 [Stellaceae bacterium]|nr:hypothetical protein [Stellaceae bacterium]